MYIFILKLLNYHTKVSPGGGYCKGYTQCSLSTCVHVVQLLNMKCNVGGCEVQPPENDDRDSQ